MSTHKTTLELEKRLEQIQSNIRELETEVGKYLLNSSSDELSRQLIDEFNQLESEKVDFQNDINQIKSLVESKESLRTDVDAIKKQSTVLLAEGQALYEKLGIALADSPEAAYGQEFEPYRQGIAELRKKNEDAQAALEALRVQMETQSFMNRLLTQVQYSARNTTANQLSKKLSAMHQKCGKEFFATGILDKLYADSALNSEVSAAYAPCADLKRRIAENDEQLEERNEELANIEKKLAERDASGNGQRRINHIQQEIQQKTQRQQILCQSGGHDFSLKYIDPDGEQLVQYKEAVAKEIASCLDKIAGLRGDSVVCRRKIQILALTEKIDASAKKISSLHHNISENQAKIEKLKMRNKELESEIAECESECEELVSMRNNLEQEDAAVTKRLVD